MGGRRAGLGKNMNNWRENSERRKLRKPGSGGADQEQVPRIKRKPKGGKAAAK